MTCVGEIASEKFIRIRVRKVESLKVGEENNISAIYGIIKQCYMYYLLTFNEKMSMTFSDIAYIFNQCTDSN